MGVGALLEIWGFNSLLVCNVEDKKTIQKWNGMEMGLRYLFGLHLWPCSNFLSGFSGEWDGKDGRWRWLG